MATPLLLNRGKRTTLPRIDKLRSRTGELTQSGWLGNPESELQELYGDLPLSLRPYYLREIALLPADQRPGVLRRCSEEMLSLPLFPDGTPTLGDLECKKFGMAVFPLTGSMGLHGIGVVACVQGEDACWIDSDEFDGPSWTLARDLCRRMVLPPAEDKHRIALASDWIITGDSVDDGTIQPVKLGNKPKAYSGSKRIWMLPAGNFFDGERPPSVMRKRVLAANLDSALAHLTGEGVTDGGLPQPWPGPEEIAEMHSFASGAMEPVIMAALLTPGVPMTLWQSPEDVSRKPAALLHDFLKNDLGFDVQALRNVPSDSIARVERTLNETLTPRLRTGDLILFNSTQGNLLMRFGLLELARRFPNLWLVYRNFDDNTQPVFDLVRFEHGLPITTQLAGLETDARVYWPELYKPHRDLSKGDVSGLRSLFLTKNRNEMTASAS